MLVHPMELPAELFHLDSEETSGDPWETGAKEIVIRTSLGKNRVPNLSTGNNYWKILCINFVLAGLRFSGAAVFRLPKSWHHDLSYHSAFYIPKMTILPLSSLQLVSWGENSSPSQLGMKTWFISLCMSKPWVGIHQCFNYLTFLIGKKTWMRLLLDGSLHQQAVVVQVWSQAPRPKSASCQAQELKKTVEHAWRSKDRAFWSHVLDLGMFISKPSYHAHLGASRPTLHKHLHLHRSL